MSDRGHRQCDRGSGPDPVCPLVRPLDGTYISGDRNSPESIREVVRRQRVDAVIDVLALTLSGTRPLIASLDGCIAQYAMLSSSDVYRNYELLHRKAEGMPTTASVDEDSPLRTTRYPYRSSPPRAGDDPDRYLDEYDKIPIEDSVRELRTDWTILRLPMVYGPGDRLRRFNWAVAHMAISGEPLVLPQDWAQWVTTYGYVENVAAAIALTVGSAVAVRSTFNLGEDAPVDHLQWARRIADVMHWEGDVGITDDPSNSFAQRLRALRLDLSGQFKVDTSRIRTELRFADSVSILQGLERTVADEVARG